MNSRGISVSILALAVLALGACNSTGGASGGGGSSSLSKPACTYTSAGITSCLKYSSSSGAVTQSSVDAACNSVSGVLSADCPTANVDVTCVSPQAAGLVGIVDRIVLYTPYASGLGHSDYVTLCTTGYQGTAQ